MEPVDRCRMLIPLSFPSVFKLNNGLKGRNILLAHEKVEKNAFPIIFLTIKKVKNSYECTPT